MEFEVILGIVYRISFNWSKPEKKNKLLSSSNTQEVMINMKEQGW